MKLIRDGVNGIVLFAIIIGLMVGFYTGVADNYGVPEPSKEIAGETMDKTIGERLNNLNIIDGISDITDAFKREKLGNLADVLGALATSAIGLLITLLGIFTFPFEIATIISQHYNIPAILTNGIMGMMAVTITFIILSAKTRGDL